MNSALYVSDTDNHVIRRIDKDSGETITVAGTASAAGNSDGIGISALFNYPFGLTNDGEFLYVADTFNHTIRRVEIQTGEVITLAGKAGEGGYTDGSLMDARFFYPSDLEVKGGELFIVDLGNDVIRVIDLSYGTVNTIAGTSRVTGFADGPVGVGNFNSPVDIAIIGDYLYVTDMENNSIRSVNISTGEIATIAGAPSYTGATDDTGDKSRFSTPGGIAIDGGVLFVADTFNHVIRKVDAETGAVTTIAGSAGVSGTTDSSESAAVFNSPTDVIADESGEYIYIVDTDNHIIRKVDLSTRDVSRGAGERGGVGLVDSVDDAPMFKSPEGITWH